MIVAHSFPFAAARPSDADRDEYTRALLNVLEDFRAEQSRLEELQRASVNIMEDFAGEKIRLEETRRAMLNLLEDFAMEREKTEAANRDLRVALDSLRLAKEAVDAANRELEAFSYSVSHDLRAPLRSIGGFSQVLLEDCARQLGEEGRDSLRRIVAAVEKMGQLIDDLLKLSRVTRVEMRRARVDLSRLVRKITDELVKSQPQRTVELVIEEGLFADGDDQLLGVALRNLFDNAWKFTSRCERARIEFGAAKSQGKAVYFVRDNGTGFDMAHAGKLFQPFQRLHKTSEFAGTGIGLASVQRIIHRHGGKVWAESKVGEGATFYFTLS